MIRSMYLGVSGMINHQARMDVVGNNISNVNTTGYKTSRANFQDALYQATGSSGKGTGANQVGTGVNIASISNDFSQGPLQATGRSLDLAISGPGFFGVVDDSGRLRFTRDGTFFVDAEGNLINSQGYKVAAEDSDDGINLAGVPLENIRISKEGKVFTIERDDDGNYEETEVGQIALYGFPNVTGLTRAGDNLYLENNVSGEHYSRADQPELFGTIHSGYLEMSNTDLARELTNLITTQRGYQANAKVFIVADEVLRDVIELKR